MKKSAVLSCLAAVLLAALLAASLCAPALAAGTTSYTIDELGLIVSIPNDLYVFTQDMAPGHPGLKHFGIDEKEMEDNLKSQGILLDAVDSGMSYEALVKKAGDADEQGPADFGYFTDEELKDTEDEIKSAYEEDGFSDITFDIRSQSQTRFIVLHCARSDGEQKEYWIIAYTLFDHKEILLIFRSFGSSMTAAQADMSLNMIDSIAFEKYAAGSSHSSPAPYYSSPSSGHSDTSSTRLLGKIIAAAVVGGISAIVAAVKRKSAQKERVVLFDSDGTVNTGPAGGQSSGGQGDQASPQYDELMNIKCPVCGASNQTDRIVCYRCGRSLKQDTASVSHSEAGADGTEEQEEAADVPPPEGYPADIEENKEFYI